MTKTFCDLCKLESRVDKVVLYLYRDAITFWQQELCKHCLDCLKERLRDFTKERSRPTC